MKEVLTRKFWKDVKKTFEEARDGTAVEAGDSDRQPASPAAPLAPVGPAAPLGALLVNRQESGADGQQGVDLADSDQRGHGGDE
jgi:hypothetical protein